MQGRCLGRRRRFEKNRFGTTEAGKASPPTKDTLYEIGSITKTFTG
jgi:CubicO group peptidase (beta-lactamase class C family)